MANIIFLGRLGRESFKGTEIQDSRTARIQLLDILFLGKQALFLFIYNSSRQGECVFMEVGIPQWLTGPLQLFLCDTIDG